MKKYVPMIAVTDLNHEDDEVRAAARRAVSIRHTMHNCERCQRECWIGPNQLSMIHCGLGEAICYYCLLHANPEAASLPVIELDTASDNVPRRLS